MPTSMIKLIPAGRPGLDSRQPGHPNMSHFPPARASASTKKQQTVEVTSVQEGGLVIGQVVSAAASQTLQFLSCKLPAAELLMTRVDRVDDLDHTFLYGARVKEKLVRCQTQLTRGSITKEKVSLTLIDWGTTATVDFQSLFHLPQELAALRPAIGWFRMRGCGHVTAKDMERLMGMVVHMKEVDTGIFNCYHDGQLVNMIWEDHRNVDEDVAACVSIEDCQL